MFCFCFRENKSVEEHFEVITGRFRNLSKLTILLLIREREVLETLSRDINFVILLGPLDQGA